jgi:large subunit ribosomal protein L29
MLRKAYQFRDLTLDQLRAKVDEESENLMNMRLQLRARKLDNPIRVRNARRELARMRTVLNERLRARSAPGSGKE